MSGMHDELYQDQICELNDVVEQHPQFSPVHQVDQNQFVQMQMPSMQQSIYSTNAVSEARVSQEQVH